MRIKQQIDRIMPAFVKRTYRNLREMKGLSSIQRLECDVNNLRPISEIEPKDFFDSPDVEKRWSDSKKTIDMLAIPDGTGGVNPGDRRAIYYLISKLNSSSVLEIGTHIGASTVHIASALDASQIKNGKSAKLVSVDIAKVNDSISKPWLKYETNNSPIEMINKMNCGTFVEFIEDTSLNYAIKCEQRFDFIFLDGDHAAKTVYQEIPLALNLLKQNGEILLHDFFPNLKSLWSDGSVIPGPFLATERLVREGANVLVLPLGKLPWPTKLQSNVTSLALLMRNE